MIEDDDTGAQGHSGREDVAEPSAHEQSAPFERWLDRKLKAAYGSVLDEAIPQDIIDLLKQKLDRSSES